MEHPVERTEGKGAFDRFAERATNFVSRIPFLILCLALLATWIVGWAIDPNFSLHHLLADLFESSRSS